MKGWEIAYCIPLEKQQFDFQGKMKKNVAVAECFDGKVQLIIGFFEEDPKCEWWLLETFPEAVKSGILKLKKFEPLPYYHVSWVMNSFSKFVTARYYSSLYGDNCLSIDQVGRTLDLLADDKEHFLIHHFSGCWDDGTLSLLTFPVNLLREFPYINELMPRQFCEIGVILSLIAEHPSLTFVFQSGENIFDRSDFCREFLSLNSIKLKQLPVDLRIIYKHSKTNRKDRADLPEKNNFDYKLNSSYTGWKLSIDEQVREKYLSRLVAMQNDYARSEACKNSLEHLYSGEDRTGLKLTDEITLYSVNRNNYSFIKPWLSHYRALGVQRFVIIDDGSKHSLKDYMPGDDVYVLRPRFATFRTSKVFWLKALMCSFQKPGSWVLTVDIDEFLDLPSDSVKLSSVSPLLKYCGVLNHSNQSFASGLLIDMMPSPVYEQGDLDDFQHSMNWYYFRPSNKEYGYQELDQVKWNFGDYWFVSFSVDIRYRLFGTIDSLRKVPLFRFDPAIDLNQGYHNLMRDGNQMTWGELLKPDQGILPIRHYKMFKIFGRSGLYDDLLERKEQYFGQTRKNLDFIRSIDKVYIERVWQATPFKRKYSGPNSYPYINKLSN